MRLLNFKIKGTKIEVIKSLRRWNTYSLVEAVGLYDELCKLPSYFVLSENDKWNLILRYLRGEGLVSFEVKKSSEQIEIEKFNKDYSEAMIWFNTLSSKEQEMIKVLQRSMVATC